MTAYSDGIPLGHRYMKYATWLAIFGITTISFTVRFIFLDRYPAPPSSDFGNYLTIIHIIEGHDVTGFGLRYPPLFFVILAPFVKLLGPMLGLKIVAAGVAASSCVPMFLLAQRWSNYPAAICVTFLFTFSQAMAEMTAWGGSPNFLAITFMIFTIYFLDRAFSPRRSYLLNGIAAGICTGLVFETHHLTAMILAAIVAIFFVFVMIWESKPNKIKGLRILASMIVPAALVSLPGIPVYFRIQQNLSTSLGGYGPASFDTLIGPGGFGRITGPYWLAWLGVFSIGGIMVALLLRYSRGIKTYKLLLSASILTPILLAAFVLGEAPGRVLAFLPIPLLLGFGIFMVAFVRWARNMPPQVVWAKGLGDVIVALFVADVVIISAAGVQWTSVSVDWYHPVTSGDMAALDWVKKNTPGDSVFATSGKVLGGAEEGDRLGWWIEGYSERTAYMVGSAQYRLFRDELVSTQDMNRFFSGTNVVENGKVQISEEYPLFYRGNPEVSFYHFGRYDPLLFLNDGTNVVDFSHEGHDHHETMIGAERQPLQIINGSSSIILSTLSSTSSYAFAREAIVNEEAGNVSIDAHLTAGANSTVTGLTIRIWPHGKSFDDLGVKNGVRSFFVYDLWGNRATIDVLVRSAGTSVDLVQFTTSDPIWGLPMVEIGLSGLNEFDVRLSITPEEVSMEPMAHLEYYNGYMIMEKYGIDYLFISTEMGNQVERFQKDSGHFKTVYSSKAVIIFQVTLH